MPSCGFGFFRTLENTSSNWLRSASCSSMYAHISSSDLKGGFLASLLIRAHSPSIISPAQVAGPAHHGQQTRPCLISQSERHCPLRVDTCEKCPLLCPCLLRRYFHDVFEVRLIDDEFLEHMRFNRQSVNPNFLLLCGVDEIHDD